MLKKLTFKIFFDKEVFTWYEKIFGGKWMTKKYLIGAVLCAVLSGLTFSCQEKEEGKEIHFGPNPGDGEDQNVRNTKEESLGPNPGDGLSDQTIHFGPSPDDG